MLVRDFQALGIAPIRFVHRDLVIGEAVGDIEC